MLLAIRDDSGDTLKGAIDGVNAVFTTSLPMRLDKVVQVFCNGMMRHPSLSNGYDIIDAQNIQLREVPEEGDTVMVMYFYAPQLSGVPNSQPVGVSTHTLRPEGGTTSSPRPSLVVQGPSSPSLSVSLTMR